MCTVLYATAGSLGLWYHMNPIHICVNISILTVTQRFSILILDCSHVIVCFPLYCLLFINVEFTHLYEAS